MEIAAEAVLPAPQPDAQADPQPSFLLEIDPAGPPLLECVPNFAEGRDEQKILSIIRAMRLPGVDLLDWSRDPDHNRSVVTIAGEPASVVEAAVLGVGKAAELIDLREQLREQTLGGPHGVRRGVHPRLGAADVVPFIPLSKISMQQTVELARQAGRELWNRWRVPVYFYEAAATRPERRRLENVRRGEYELARERAPIDPNRQPDIGGPGLNETAGASIVGARNLLIAWNVMLDSEDVQVARKIAKAVRESSGGFASVKALGVMVRGKAQLTMNLTDYTRTAVAQVYERVVELSSAAGVAILEGELIGLAPERAVGNEKGPGFAEWTEVIPGFQQRLPILERRLKRPMKWPEEGPVTASALQ